MTNLARRELLLAGAALGGLALAPSVLAQEVLTIGYSGPLSGGAALYGKNVLDGMLFAVNEINGAGLEVDGKPLELKVSALDDKYNPSETATNAQRLVQQDKVPVVLVPHSGGIFAVQTRNQAQKLLLLAYSSIPDITARGNQLTVRIPPDIRDYMPAFIAYQTKRFGKKLGIAVTDSDYGKVWEKLFAAQWKAAGGDVVLVNSMSYNKSADFYAGVSRVLAAEPDTMLIGGPSEPTGLVARQARELGYKGGFMLVDQAKLDEVAEVTDGLEVLEGTIGWLPVMTSTTPHARAFIKRFQAANPGRPVSMDSALPYVSTWALAEAMKLAGTGRDTQAIRAQMDAGYKALPDSINFLGCKGVGEKGELEFALQLAVVEDAKIREVEASQLVDAS